MTALVSLSVGGAVTGFAFVPKAAADISSPSSMPLNLVALRQSARAAQSPQTPQAAPSHDAMLRAAIVHVADYYLRMAQTKSPAEMEAIIWQHDSADGADHGESCAAFASLTLELGAQVVGRESWVSGGGSYPWPLHSWADVRVEPNPASLGIISVQQDAEANHRWHPLGDGYQPLPGDWVLFNGHVEVVTKDAGGVLRTVGGDSLPNFSVNAHEYPQPLSAAGVVGFVNNGSVPSATQSDATQAPAPASRAPHRTSHPGVTAGHGALADIPGAAPTATQPASTAAPAATASPASSEPATPAATGAPDPAIPGLVPAPRSGPAAAAGTMAPARRAVRAGKKDKIAPGGAAIPGLDAADLVPGKTGSAYRRHHPSPVHKPPTQTQAQRAFISEVAPGAIAAQHRYGVPAAVTIAQAIDESGWGQSQLAAQDHNLFGIKGTGPAGSVPLPTQEYVNGQPVSTSASFRVYHDLAESIDDHGRLLAQSGYYQQAMAHRQSPNEFAKALTGVYATDPNYGSNLITLMLRYDLYHYGAAEQGQATQRAVTAEPGSATIPGVGDARSAPAERTGSAGPRSASRPRPGSPGPRRPGRPRLSRPGRPRLSRPGRPARSPAGPPAPSRRRPAARSRHGRLAPGPPGPRARSLPGPLAPSRRRPAARSRHGRLAPGPPGPAARSPPAAAALGRPGRRARSRGGPPALGRARRHRAPDRRSLRPHHPRRRTSRV